jgi:hypothetical protein
VIVGHPYLMFSTLNFNDFIHPSRRGVSAATPLKSFTQEASTSTTHHVARVIAGAT